MQRVSTNLTLFYKFFIPIFWIVFFGAFTITTFAYRAEYYGDIPGQPFRIGTVIFFVSGVALLYFSLMRLKRVEMDELFVYVTNYFKNFRYPFHNIQKISQSKFLFLNIVTIHLKTPGTFGKSIRFIASNARYNSFWEQYPELKEQVEFED